MGSEKPWNPIVGINLPAPCLDTVVHQTSSEPELNPWVPVKVHLTAAASRAISNSSGQRKITSFSLPGLAPATYLQASVNMAALKESLLILILDPSSSFPSVPIIPSQTLLVTVTKLITPSLNYLFNYLITPEAMC